MATRHGPRQVGDIGGLTGSFYLRPTGQLAGFSIQLDLSETLGDSHRGPDRNHLFWEALDLHHSSGQDFAGDCMLGLEGHRIKSDAFGKIVRLGSPGLENSYFRITLTSDFRGVTLHWPHAIWRRFHNVEIRFFTEIHQRTAR